MKIDAIATLSVGDLVEQFVALAIQQDEALLMDEIASVKRLYWAILDIENELKRRPGDMRLALQALFDHPNAQVRLAAGSASLAVAPAAARQVLQDLIDGRWFPQAATAGGLLRAIDRGDFKPS